MVFHLVTLIFLVNCLTSFCLTNSVVDDDVSCGDPKWRLDTKDPNWNGPVKIWTIRNVSLTPSDSPHFLNVNVLWATKAKTAELQYLPRSCSGVHGHRFGKPVFFNCPCEFDEISGGTIQLDKERLCPGSLVFNKGPSVVHQEISCPSRNALFIFNTWASSSPYHGIIDALFPLWLTVRLFHQSFNQSTERLTTLNLGATCSSNKRATVQPLVEALFGPGTYEDTSGSISHSFTSTCNTKYNYLIYGFHYSLRPFPDNRKRLFNPELGKMLREFAITLKARLMEQTSAATSARLSSHPPTYASPPPSSPLPWDQEIKKVTNTTADGRTGEIKPLGAVFIDRSGRDDRHISDYTHMRRSFTRNGLHVHLADFGRGSLSTYAQQAHFSSQVTMLVGVQGAGFTQQLFMPLGGVLVILHTPSAGSGRSLGDIARNRWHEAVAQYLDHSVLNLACTDLRARASPSANAASAPATALARVWDHIAAAVRMFAEMHEQWSEKARREGVRGGRRKFGVCDIHDIVEWKPEANKCDTLTMMDSMS